MSKAYYFRWAGTRDGRDSRGSQLGPYTSPDDVLSCDDGVVVLGLIAEYELQRARRELERFSLFSGMRLEASKIGPDGDWSEWEPVEIQTTGMSAVGEDVTPQDLIPIMNGGAE